MDPGDVLELPPVDYDHETTANINKEIIKESARQMDFCERQAPVVTRQADVPFIKTATDISIGLSGIRFESAVSGLTDAIVSSGTSYINYPISEGLGGILIYLEQTTGSNLNKTVVRNASGINIGGDVVKVTNPSGDLPDINAIELIESNPDGDELRLWDADGNQYYSRLMGR